MKRSTTLALILGILFICGLIAYATASQAGGNGSIDAWMAAQRQTPALWALDVAALYALLLSASYGSQSARLQSRNTQIDRLNDEHRKQLEAMIANTDRAEEINATQANQIAAQGDQIGAQDKAIRSLSEQAAGLQREVTARQAEIDTRQEAFEAEARRLTEQAFRALSGQVDANARQLDAVNLALQYHRAEIQQLRHGLRAVQPGSEPTHVARLTPAEMTAITTQSLVADAELPISEGQQDQHPMSDTRHPQSENAPGTVIMETIHFRVVPEVEAVPEYEGTPVISVALNPEGDTKEEDTKVALDRSELSAPVSRPEIVTPDEFSALLSPPTANVDSPRDTNANASLPQPEERLSHWRRTL